ncbi:hypothetical protein [Sphingomonas xinjiangensis]|uniref:Uncharacterized protein n=1 Tax=Sphingomonas xinjiangensis TaxID=643568 RepID=A0A840YSL8_9SPHN|nr:hypothetical protein [Sphingomonas xinjiangensis]MBB5712686.1 hypothetical protein [Sphingomonas xinjiangensis]
MIVLLAMNASAGAILPAVKSGTLPVDKAPPDPAHAIFSTGNSPLIALQALVFAPIQLT